MANTSFGKKLADSIASIYSKPATEESEAAEKSAAEQMVRKADPEKRKQAAASMKKAFGGY